MRRRTITLPPWARAREQRQLETGGAIVALRQKGHRWDDLARAFDLDTQEVRRLAVRYLLASATQGPQGTRESPGVPDAPADSQDAPPATR